MGSRGWWSEYQGLGLWGLGGGGVSTRDWVYGV